MERYSIGALLGEGSFARVYSGTAVESRELVAIKVPRSEVPFGGQILRAEFRARLGMHHANLVAVRELVDTPSGVVLIMEHVHGVPLSQLDAGTADPAIVETIAFSALSGLLALHANGLVHGDVKPTNIMVRPDGNSVMIDFDLSGPAVPTNSFEQPLGTLMYAAPELLLGQPRTPAADLFSLGIVLLELILGRHPGWRRGMPDLSAENTGLCTEVPSHTPDRLRGLIEDLLGPPRHRIATRGMPSARAPHAFFGREVDLRLLHQADAHPDNHTLIIRGPAGIGKSRLAEEFLRARHVPNSLQWKNACHPSARIPFEGIQGWIDALSIWLTRQQYTRVSEALASAASSLSCVFPNLLQHGREKAPSKPSLDDAIDAFVTVVAEVAKVHPLTLWLEDAHWQSEDATPFIVALVERCPADVRILITTRPSESTLPGFTLDLEPLDEEAVGKWASALDRPPPSSMVGNPWLLTLFFGSEGHDGTTSGAVLTRLQHLGPIERRALAIAVVSTVPLQLPFLRLCEIGDTAIETLLGNGLLTLTRTHGTTAIKPSHDLVREVVSTHTDTAPERRVLVNLLLSQHEVKAARIAGHLIELNDPQCAVWATRAAREAEALFAWASAAHWHGVCLSHGVETDSVRTQYARALTRAGRVEEAMAAWTQAAQRTIDSRVAVDSRIEASTLAFGSGQVERGLALVRPAAKQVNVHLPTSLIGSVVQTVYWRLRRKLWKMRGMVKGTRQPGDHVRLKLLWTVAGALGSQEGTLGVGLHARHLFEAEKHGDSTDFARAHAVFATYELGWGKAPERTDPYLENMKHSAESTNSMEKRALWMWGAGYSAFITGKMDQARDYLDVALHSFTQIEHEGWEREHAERHTGWVARYSGDYARMRQIGEMSIQRGKRSGSVAHEHQARLGLRAWGYLLGGEAQRCADEIQAVTLEAGQNASFATRYTIHHTFVRYLLYTGEYEAAERSVKQVLRGDFHIGALLHGRLEGKMHIALAGFLRGGKRQIAAIQLGIRQLKYEPSGWGRASLTSLKACEGWLLGTPRKSADLYASAREQYHRLGQHDAADACSTHLLHLEDAHPNYNLLIGRGIKQPALWLRTSIPGPATQPISQG